MPVPVVCAIHGYCIGSGVEIALLCDLRLASADATFAMPEVRLGMIPAAGGTQTLARYLGQPASLELLLSGRRLDSSDAQRFGLVHRLLPSRETLDSEAEFLSQRLARVAPPVVQVKRAVRWGMDQPLASALETELRLSAQTLAGGTT